ncbi:hypothetical protein J0676_09235 [Vibrio sp. Vb2880]|uniref:Transcription initiation factor TFIIIB n=1 Tax=Vibrio furnissii TaxID=29494 RepID=A0A0Q2N8C4_VIBFU|nr:MULTISPECIES: hypothetical protein [Vibrio]KQH88047.1 hypothetical protein AMR76_01815 [Vibrio furnissii]MBO0213677.1 hypothetical protein [Vibrio sp. Vb2880]MCG6217260.1 hypothetical protein [Vibrio furnissii]MCG6228899.1 hypothetical protein [Vibrio furnissii]MCG6234598.1 hypothetical protein [Vibrio furnissii]
MTKSNHTDALSLDCCPLCQHDEYLMSEDGEKFICGQCGFKTDHLKSIQLQLMLLHHSSALHRTHSLRPTMH